MGGFKEPIVTFKDLRVRGLGITGGSLDAYLNVYNPNGFKLDATRLTYKVLVGENPLGTGVLDSRFTVQNHDSTTIRIPIDFTYAGVGAAGRVKAVAERFGARAHFFGGEVEPHEHLVTGAECRRDAVGMEVARGQPVVSPELLRDTQGFVHGAGGGGCVDQ